MSHRILDQPRENVLDGKTNLEMVHFACHATLVSSTLIRKIQLIDIHKDIQTSKMNYFILWPFRSIKKKLEQVTSLLPNHLILFTQISEFKFRHHFSSVYMLCMMCMRIICKRRGVCFDKNLFESIFQFPISLLTSFLAYMYFQITRTYP